MPYDNQGIIERLQSLDPATKTKILIVATAVIMVAVIYFWLAYFNNILVSAGQPTDIAGNDATLQQGVDSGQAAPTPGIWHRIGNGAVFMETQFMNMVHRLGSALDAPRQYIVRPQ